MHGGAQNFVAFLGQLKSEGEVPFCTILLLNNKYLTWFKVKLVHKQPFRLVREQ